MYPGISQFHPRGKNANGGWAQLELSDSLKFNSAESVYLDS